MSKLPDGLVDLIEKVIKENPLKRDLSDKNNLWRDFTWGVFLVGNRINAEVTYIRDTLWDANLLDKDWILNHTQQEWEEKAKKFISNKINSLSGRKAGALSGILSNLSEPAESLKGSAIFFKNKNISPQFLIDVFNKGGIENLIRQMTYQPASSYITGRFNPDKIPYIALVKAIIWLQGYGLTEDFCPPSRQIKDFVDDDIKHLTWLQKKSQPIKNYPQDWDYIIHMRDFNKKEIKPVLPKATVRDTGIAIWYWKIVQGLLKGSGFKTNFTPKKLLSYLKLEGMDLNDLGELIDDIDEVDNLTNDIKTFLQANP
jgi:hypothetical protein